MGLFDTMGAPVPGTDGLRIPEVVFGMTLGSTGRAIEGLTKSETVNVWDNEGPT